MQTKVETKPLHLGFTQLAWAWFYTVIINFAVMFGCYAIFDKPKTAMMATLTVLAVAIVWCGKQAWKEKRSATWQYSLSQLALSGTVFAGVACGFVTAGFMIAVLVFGMVTAVLVYFNLSNAALRKAHEAYVPIHAITGAIALVLAYAKYAN